MSLVAMASSFSTTNPSNLNLLHPFSLRTRLSFSCCCKAQAQAQLSPKPKPNPAASRRQLLFLLTATTALKAVELPSRAQDIPLFGLRKKLKKVEEEAEELVKEGFESAEKGLESAEQGVEAAEKEIEAAEKEIMAAEVTFGGGIVQAGVVVGAEAVGVLVASSVVNGILGSEA